MDREVERMYYESCVREIGGKEYLLHASGAEVQDFIRYQKVVPTRQASKDYTSLEAQFILSNGKNPSAQSIASTIGPIAFVSGRHDGPTVPHDAVAHVGVYKGIFHDACTHAFHYDPIGSSLGAMRARRGALPVLAAHILTDPRVLRDWSRRAPVFIYKQPSLGTDCVGVLARSLSTELYGPDPICSALHFVADHCKCYGVIICGADRSFAEMRPGCVKMGDRFVYPEHVATIHQMHLICGVMLRNNMRVLYVKDTMIPIPEAEAIDSDRIEEEADLLIQEVT